MTYDPTKPASPSNPPPGGYNPPTDVDVDMTLSERGRSVVKRIRPYVDELVTKMLTLANDGDARVALQATTWLLERYGGKAVQALVGGEDGGPIKLGVVLLPAENNDG